jgi:hypothetical protein
LETVLSLVIPTRNEAENVGKVVERVAEALEDIPYELLFADDSDDDTPQRIAQLAETDSHVRLVRRPEETGHVDTLPATIVAALRQASGSYIGVLDADLSHPPELLPKLLAVAKEADLVVASRFLPVGGQKDQRGGSTALSAQAGKSIARALFRRARACTDPLSGFFVFRREVIQRVKLRPRDTHLLLEILVRGRWSRLAEVPYHVADSQRMPEKASSNAGMAYARQLRTLVFQGEWGRGPVQYLPADEAGRGVALDAASAGAGAATAEDNQIPATPAIPWRQIAMQATALWLVSRVMLGLLTYYSALFQASLANPNQNSVPRTNPVITPDLLLGRWLQWDGTYYVNIARVGYAQTSWTAFFPFYPFLTHLLAIPLGPGSELLSAMIISNLATLVAFIGLGCLVALEGGTGRAISQTILVLTAYPLAFFLAAPYTEGLFLAGAVWALYAARRGWWTLGIVCTLLGGLCRPTGVILVLPLLYEFGRQHLWWQRLIAGVRQRDWTWLRQLPREHPWRQLLTVLGIGAAVPVGFGVFAAVCAQRFGDPLLFIKVHDQWDRVQLPIWTALVRGAEWQGAILFLHQGFWSYENARNLVDFAPVVIMALLTLVSVRRMPFSFTLYMLGLLYISIDPAVRIGQNTVEYDSAGRFLLLSVPVFLLLGRWSARYAWLEMLLVGGGFLLQAAFASYYLAGGWMI